MSTRMCEAISTELVAYLDGEETEPAREAIDAHVATCLPCRREIEQITKLNTLVARLPHAEPRADFEARTWQRLHAAAPAVVRQRRFRPARWGAPALAAAAAVALVWYWQLGSQDHRGPVSVPPEIAAAPGEPARVAGAPAVRARVAEEGDATRATGTREQGTTVAAASQRGVPETPEDLPPELLEHPELFLRYPVVRRLKKLEHFEAVQQRVQPEHRGERMPAPSVG